MFKVKFVSTAVVVAVVVDVVVAAVVVAAFLKGRRPSVHSLRPPSVLDYSDRLKQKYSTNEFITEPKPETDSLLSLKDRLFKTSPTSSRFLVLSSQNVLSPLI